MGYTFDGRSFSSIDSLAAYVGLNTKTLTARLRRGMSVEEACIVTDYRCRYFEEDSVNKSVTQLCKDNQKNRDLVSNRLKYGYSIEKALNSPKKVTKQGEPIVVYGTLYNSLAAAIRKFDLQPKEQRIRRRIKAGQAPNAVFSEMRHEVEDGI